MRVTRDVGEKGPKVDSVDEMETEPEVDVIGSELDEEETARSLLTVIIAVSEAVGSKVAEG